MRHLQEALEQLRIPYGEGTIERFARYREMVLSWNEKVNLTAVKDPEAFEIKHFVDSLICCGQAPFEEAERIIDVGTGAGFPGIPLAILYPEKEFVLLDSLNKRIKIVVNMAEALELRNVKAVHGRAEELARRKEYREGFHLCLSRAVADLAVLSEYCLPFVRVGGWFGAYKSLGAEEELCRSQGALETLGGALEGQVVSPFASLGLEHQLLWIRKRRPTPSKYPRKAGTPEKQPLK